MMLLLHVLMLSLLSGGSAKVVLQFEQNCDQFFANGKPPTRFSEPPTRFSKPPTRFYGPSGRISKPPRRILLQEKRYEQICQTLNNVVHFATYYDTRNRIPVYSAYKFEGIKGCKRQTVWHIEPQVDYNNGGSNMASEGSVCEHPLGSRQALNEDYTNSGFHRGHLAPVYHEYGGPNMGSVRSVPLNLRGSHQARYIDYKNFRYDIGHLAPVYQARSQRCAEATFTLTNAAPQHPRFNRVSWWDVEKTLATYLESQCRPRHIYIVTGVVPGNTYIKNRVNVPSHFWTAFCCLNQDNRCSRSRGVIGNNNKNSSIIGMTVADLERELQDLYGTKFRIFQQ